LNSALLGVTLFGLACAANPWGIMIAVLLLDATRGHGIVWAYVVAWIGAISVVLVFLLMGVGAFVESGSNSASTAASVADLVIGLGLLGWGVARVIGGRRAAAKASAGSGPKETGLPGWLRAIENISYVGAFLLGIYSATYPMVVGASGEILRAAVTTTQTVALAVWFVILGSLSVAGVAAIGTFFPTRSEPLLARLRTWLTAHNRDVITAIVLVFGLALTGRGLPGLV
jgi:hypothetical protein